MHKTGSTAGMDFYIYYRVRPEHAAALQTRATAMQMTLRQTFGIRAGLKRRPLPVESSEPNMQNWMEVYLAVPPEASDDFAVALDRAAQQSGLAALIDGQRHVECFMDISPCA
jgi:hypothetical protein